MSKVDTYTDGKHTGNVHTTHKPDGTPHDQNHPG